MPVDCVMPGCGDRLLDDDRLMERPAMLCRSARLRIPLCFGQCSDLFLQLAVELRLGEKSAGCTQYVIGTLQLLVLTAKSF